MSEEDRARLDLRQRCEEVLYYVWDPIGVHLIPQTFHEYSSYVPEVLLLLKSGADAAAIAIHLSAIEIEQMGLGPGRPDLSSRSADRAAQCLVDWREYLAQLAADLG